MAKDSVVGGGSKPPIVPGTKTGAKGEREDAGCGAREGALELMVVGLLLLLLLSVVLLLLLDLLFIFSPLRLFLLFLFLLFA